MSMPTQIAGIIEGRTIRLIEESGLPDGQKVLVKLEPVSDSERLAPGEGIKRAAGAWDDDPEGLEAFLKWNRQQRKAGRQPLQP